MGLSAGLVREFQSWITSSASRPVVERAARSCAPELAAASALAPDALKLSAAATRARAKGPRLAAPRTGEQLLASRRVALNRIEGDRRELIVQRFLQGRFKREAGYTVLAEQYLRDAHGQIALDAKTGQSRRLDFVVFQGRGVTSTVEVTSRTASKTAQSAKELQIRDAGGRYLLHPVTGKLVKLPADQRTAVLRLA